MSEIKYLIVMDWDGCGNSATGGPGVHWILEGVKDLALCIEELNRKAPEWGFVLDTGRDYHYGLALVEALGLMETNLGLWSGFEGGLVLCQHKNPWKPIFHKVVTNEYLEARNSLNAYLLPIILGIGGAEEVKEVCLTYNPPPGTKIEGFYNFILGEIRGRRELEKLTHSSSKSAVDFSPFNGGKEDTIFKLCSLNSVIPKNVFYIGDGGSDAKVFPRVGLSGAPGNANDEVKKAAKVAAKEAAPWGTIALIRHHVFGDKWGIEGIKEEWDGTLL